MQRTPHKWSRFALSSIVCAVVGLAPAPHALAQSGSWQPLNHQPPVTLDTMLLLTDGTVMANEDLVNGNGAHWWKLTPDSTGSYINGTWTQLATAPTDRLFFASAVLADGRVIVSGGEYSNIGGSETNRTEIYNPITNTWKSLSPPSGWSIVGDAPCCVLPNDTFLLGNIGDTQTAIFTPGPDTWAAGPNKSDSQSTEEAWELLPDNTVLVVECINHPNAEKYVYPNNTFVSAGNTLPDDLVDPQDFEVGASILLPDGRAFCIGATPETALYTMPSSPTQPGTWNVGPNPPIIGGLALGAEDAPACLLPNGHVLMSLGPTGPNFMPPTYFFEFDPITNTLTQVSSPPTSNNSPYVGRMLLTPTGQVLFSVGESGDNRIYVYTPTGNPQSSWAPVITSVSTSLQAGNSYVLQGQQLNGLSQDCGYGDDASMATNYPLVQLKNTSSGAITYCRTSNHSTMGVATGANIVSTNFTVPTGLASGTYNLTVITNGIPSNSISVTVGGQNTAPLSSLTLNPTTVNGGASSTGTVTLASVQSTDTTVTLSSSNTSVAQVPASITIPHGNTTGTFTVTTSSINSDTTVTISATSANTVTANLTVLGLTVTQLTISPNSVPGGQQTTGRVFLSGNASGSGAVVSLSSSNPGVAQVPSSVTVTQGTNNASFTITTNSVNQDTTVTITATFNNSSQSATLTVTAPHLTSFTLNKSSVKGGKKAKGTVTIDSVATSNLSVSVSSSNPAVAIVPSTVTIPAGSSSATFKIKTKKVSSSTTVTISVTFNGATLTQNLTVIPP